MGVQAIKHEALLREWAGRFAECRSSGKTVKAWCEAQGLSIKKYYYWEKRVVAKAKEEGAIPTTTQSGLLLQVNPATLPCGDSVGMRMEISIRYGESIITIPAGINMESIAELVKALNRHV